MGEIIEGPIIKKKTIGILARYLAMLRQKNLRIYTYGIVTEGVVTLNVKKQNQCT